MKNSLIIYITLGVLFIVPLVLFNIRKIWVRRPPAPMRFKPGRLVFVTLTTAFILVFLITAYQKTLTNRYEIANERIAEQHAEAIVGKTDMTVFRDFIVTHGTENVGASFDTTVFPAYGDASSVRFQISNALTPKYWEDVEGFEQVLIEGDENPLYLMYLMVVDGREEYYALRLKKTADGWKYDWFGNANEIQQKKIDMPTKKNGKWFTVNR